MPKPVLRSASSCLRMHACEEDVSASSCLRMHACGEDVSELQQKLSSVGWIQCDNPNCLKWRQVRLQVLQQVTEDTPWTCDINEDDSYNRCSIPEEDTSSYEKLAKRAKLDIITSRLKPGALVWAKVQGYCRWPALITADPLNGEHADEDHFEAVQYHVEFLGDKRSHGWIKTKSIQVFGPGNIELSVAGSQVQQGPAKKLKSLTSASRVNDKDGSHKVQKAIDEALKLLPLPLEARLKTCQFVTLSSVNRRSQANRTPQQPQIKSAYNLRKQLAALEHDNYLAAGSSSMGLKYSPRQQDAHNSSHTGNITENRRRAASKPVHSIVPQRLLQVASSSPGVCALSGPGVCALSGPGVCALSGPGVCALSGPGVCALSGPGVCALSGPGVCALSGPGVCALSGPGVCALSGPGVCALSGPGVCALSGPGVCALSGPGVCALSGPGVCALSGPGVCALSGPVVCALSECAGGQMRKPDCMLFPSCLIDTSIEDRFMEDVQMYQENEQLFEQELALFNARCALKPADVPTWQNIQADKYCMFLAVMDRGGCLRVSDQHQWSAVYTEVTNLCCRQGAGWCKKYYHRNLYPFELYMCGHDYSVVVSELDRCVEQHSRTSPDRDAGDSGVDTDGLETCCTDDEFDSPDIIRHLDELDHILMSLDQAGDKHGHIQDKTSEVLPLTCVHVQTSHSDDIDSQPDKQVLHEMQALQCDLDSLQGEIDLL